MRTASTPSTGVPELKLVAGKRWIKSESDRCRAAANPTTSHNVNRHEATTCSAADINSTCGNMFVVKNKGFLIHYVPLIRFQNLGPKIHKWDEADK